MSSSILKLREFISKKKRDQVKLEPVDDIADATELRVGDEVFGLDEPTQFVTEDKASGESTDHLLRTVYHCLVCQALSTTDYVSQCESKKIPIISFLERTELISWLTGSSSTCQYVTGKTSAKSSEPEPKKRKVEDPFLAEILANERNLIDHNRALRGGKPIDFSSVAKDCENKIIRPLKQQQRKQTAVVKTPSSADRHKRKDPIIILSPAASALMTMANIKDFLELGKFVDPTQVQVSSNNMLILQRKSQRFGKEVKFLVVDNVEKFFTKPEYWDRVVAVFTTGQKWQFKSFKYPDPNVLFQKVKGFYVHYAGDTVPATVKQWNVQVVEIDRNKRFKDRQTSEFVMDSLEKSMSSKGFGR
ncbi:unnamed protein product [Kuraishia capsulata CBS 1993]|uniref:Cell division control protein 73 C-terminal domain-containing protein n=1 Tax=Kuraishia capsulata CBS 1993 TaxID=1382522 RepID=W6MG13_9ASCO|nr:uncharacterized protein KUCA_T00000329001 [Kuraishia capsulata CBS 1993]CDK24368.1 unnamed protein product [Kuraishia capsulata CBS 1993]